MRSVALDTWCCRLWPSFVLRSVTVCTWHTFWSHWLASCHFQDQRSGYFTSPSGNNALFTRWWRILHLALQKKIYWLNLAAFVRFTTSNFVRYLRVYSVQSEPVYSSHTDTQQQIRDWNVCKESKNTVMLWNILAILNVHFRMSFIPVIKAGFGSVCKVLDTNIVGYLRVYSAQRELF